MIKGAAPGLLPRKMCIRDSGNIYVATAKQLCYARGLCDIDMIAGPSEIMIVSDANSNPVQLAADLLSQAEHDRLSSAWLAVTDAGLAKAVAVEVERQLKLLPREEIARASICLLYTSKSWLFILRNSVPFLSSSPVKPWSKE